MSRLRLLFFWLLVLAVPLQGFAATTKLLCGTIRTTAHHHGDAVAGGEHGHGSHVHDTGQGTPSPDEHGAASTSTSQASPAHQCGLCAACCHAVAVAPAQGLLLPSGAPQAHELDLVAGTVPDLSLKQPEKPPRA